MSNLRCKCTQVSKIFYEYGPWCNEPPECRTHIFAGKQMLPFFSFNVVISHVLICSLKKTLLFVFLVSECIHFFLLLVIYGDWFDPPIQSLPTIINKNLNCRILTRL